MNSINFIRPLVSNILFNWERRTWTTQGFGMMRTYFGPRDDPKRFRLNVWDSSLKVPNVSVIHDHPWHFEPLIVCGSFCNQRFGIEDPAYGMPTHHYTTIKTGEGGGPEGRVTRDCRLNTRDVEHYFPGMTYSQRADEIHASLYRDGTVTLNERDRVGDGEHARVFWEYGTSWVNAKPRTIYADEIIPVAHRAMELLK